MTRKILLLLPVAVLFTACNNKEIPLNLNNDDKIKEKKDKEVVLSYEVYKQLRTLNNTISTLDAKSKSSSKTVLTPKEKDPIKEIETKKTFASVNNDITSKNTNSTKSKTDSFMEFYSEWKDVKYKMGGTSKSGIDCSAFTQKVFKEKFGVSIPRTTRTQVGVGTEVKRSELIAGDLVFFKTGKTDRHVGIYMGNGDFLHASIKGVIFTKLDKPFYKKNYWTSRRIID